MNKRLLALNVLLAAVSVACLAFIAQQLGATPPSPTRPRPGAAAPSPAVAAPEPPRAPVGAYGVISTKSLFNPMRTEAPVATVSGPTVTAVKPLLHGVVMRDANPIAYLEDPLTKRVAGYRIGDSVAGGRVARITADHVVIARPEGDLNVRLRDPSKPRPPAPPTRPIVPGQVPTPGLPGAPVPGGIQPGLPGPPSPGGIQPGLVPPRAVAPHQPTPQIGTPPSPLFPSRRGFPGPVIRPSPPPSSEPVQPLPQTPQQ